jgi:sulfate permease, SulP family
MLHAVFLLAVMVVAAPLASYVPLPALAGVLVLVAWNMAEKPAIAQLLRDPRTGAVLVTTFGLTVARDLTTGIGCGCALAAALRGLEAWRTQRSLPPSA